MVAVSSCDSIFYYPTRIRYDDVKGNYDDIYISSGSGNRLHGYFFPSQEQKALVLFFHGNYRNITALYKTFSWLTYFGYDYMIVDYSGYGQSSGRADRRNLHLDGISMLEYAHAKSRTRDYPLIVIGQSIGGAVLLGSLGDFAHTEDVSLAVIDCSFPSYKEIANYHTHHSTKLPLPLGTLIITDRYEPRDSLDVISSIPVLVSHCREDKTVPIQFGRALYDEIRGEKWFWELECKHSGAYWKNDNQKRLADFFDRHISQNSTVIPDDT